MSIFSLLATWPVGAIRQLLACVRGRKKSTSEHAPVIHLDFHLKDDANCLPDVTHDHDAPVQLAVESDAHGQNDSCTFLQLPADIMYLVFQVLESEHQLPLALTCRALHGFRASMPRQQLTAYQQCEYLACIARSFPQRWVCELCLQLHEIDPMDTPRNIKSMTCPLGSSEWIRRAYGFHWHVFDSRRLKLDHRHVQLALKHLRLRKSPQDEPGEYATKLLTPYHNDKFEIRSFGPSKAIALAARYSIYPKAKADTGGQLRYLTLTVFEYRRDREPVSLAAMWDLVICPHLGFRPYKAALDLRYPELWHNPFLPEDRLGGAIRTAFAQYADRDRDFPDGAGPEVCGACARCRTDFSVRASPDYAELRVWQDMGTEGSPRNIAWRSQIMDLRRASIDFNRIREGLTLHHEPGSVRDFYEGPGEEYPQC